jgi:hypothetical protein
MVTYTRDFYTVVSKDFVLKMGTLVYGYVVRDMCVDSGVSKVSPDGNLTIRRS